jgi:hypothetical protein
LPSFRRIFERRNMMAAQYPHGRDPGNSLGRHYSDFQLIGRDCLKSGGQAAIAIGIGGYGSLAG